MKKWMILLSVFLLAAGVWLYGSTYNNGQVNMANQRQGNLKAGVYKVEYDQPDFRGWKAFFSMVVNQDGEMESITFDYVDKAGILKTKNAPYNQAMKKKNGIGPAAYCPRFSKNLEIYQDPDKVDAITGATHSSHDFKDFAKAAYEAAKEGKTATIYLPQPEAIDKSSGEKK